jgi:surface antigen
MKRFFKFLVLLLLVPAAVYLIFLYPDYPPRALAGSLKVGSVTDEHRGVKVYNNGPDFPKSHGKHYAAGNSFYFGKKWQCVEFIKRYYFLALSHQMPDGSGNAKDFFDAAVKHGKLNRRRNLLQYHNGANDKPRPDDILVFDGSYGHVAIVTRVDADELEVIQQNIFMRPRQKFSITKQGEKYVVGG